MDLIGNDGHMVPVADFGEFLQGLARPDDAGRVVRIREDQQPAGRIPEDRLQVLEVHVIAAVFPQDQRIVDHLAAVVLRDQPERVIHRRLDDDFVFRTQQGVDDHADSLYDAGDEGEPFFLNFPAMAVAQPADDGFVPGLRHDRIAENRMFQPFFHGIHNERRRLEIHIGYPEGQQICSPEIIGEGFVFDRTGSAAVDNLVKIVHGRNG